MHAMLMLGEKKSYTWMVGTVSVAPADALTGGEIQSHFASTSSTNGELRQSSTRQQSVLDFSTYAKAPLERNWSINSLLYVSTTGTVVDIDDV